MISKETDVYIDRDGYGIVYTPGDLAAFVASLAVENLARPIGDTIKVLDPACGGCSLLSASAKALGDSYRLYGIDLDERALIRDQDLFPKRTLHLFNDDFIKPKNGNGRPDAFWHIHLGYPDLIIANPPWSSERIYSKAYLRSAGFEGIGGQYDAYTLFLKESLRLVKTGGICAFIIPDSFFSQENAGLRKWILSNFELVVAARLGEKLFPTINRSTAVIVVRNIKPSEESEVQMFRLKTDARRRVLSGDADLLTEYRNGVHMVKQSTLLEDSNVLLDVDSTIADKGLLAKIGSASTSWAGSFHYSRGIEISKGGETILCPHCGARQAFKKSQLLEGKKRCVACSEEFHFDSSCIQGLIFDHKKAGLDEVLVGESVGRYCIGKPKFILPDVDGIRYKGADIYFGPKILIRKTGLGINATIDYSNRYFTQTVYALSRNQDDPTPLAYYLGLLNSRVLFYFYLKKYGENEWKSHPYLTKHIIYSLPLMKPDNPNDQIVLNIANLASALVNNYDHLTDLELEGNVEMLYGITPEEHRHIERTLNDLPDLAAFKAMRY